MKGEESRKSRQKNLINSYKYISEFIVAARRKDGEDFEPSQFKMTNLQL